MRPRFERIVGTRSSEFVIIPIVVLERGQGCWAGGVCEFEVLEAADGGVERRRCWRRRWKNGATSGYRV